MTAAERNHHANLTILFADVCRSTELFEQLGDKQARSIIGAALADMAAIVVHCQGSVIKSLGDELMCTFAQSQHAADAASFMQNQVPKPLTGCAADLQLRIGFHHGEVLQEQDDVFGDAVNVAARLASTAKAGQILVSTASTSELKQHPLRPLGVLALKGRQQPVDVSELLWQPDQSELTTVVGAVSDQDLAAAMRLVLRFDGRQWELTGGSFPTTIGRDAHNDLIIDQPLVSRHHATIEARLGYFTLIDRSTNGTAVVIDGEVIELQRSELRLRRSGEIRPGKSDLEPILFETG